MSFSNPIEVTYTAAANASLSTAAVAKRIIGPKGKRGRIRSAAVITTTATTVAASAVQVGPAGGTATECLDMVVPVTAINLGVSATQAEISAGADLAADTVYEISGDGGASAGAGDITITVGWF